MLFWIGVAHAQGPLAASHANLACTDCHDGIALTCARCHVDVAQRGLHPAFAARPCVACHGEHRGATFDLTGALSAYDHASWPLGGAHAKQACARCHTTVLASGRTRFTGLSTMCGTCHRANPHRFAGPEMLRCDRCHGDAAWLPTKPVMDFDHDATSLPLDGGHRRVACVQCHPRSQFALAKPDCASCHAPKHASPLFDARACEDCHTSARFDVVAFDHGAKMPLEGGHRIACARCHVPALGQTVPPAACETCHRERPHGKRFDRQPGGCAGCHTAVKWTVVGAFQHATTKFALGGKHRDLACGACHRSVGAIVFERVAAGCKGCHAHRSVHADADHPRGKYTTAQCTNCHVNNMQEPPHRPQALFHGPQSAFPLVKGHARIPCSDCHALQQGRRFDAPSPACGPACHRDAHAGALGTECQRCHVSGQWVALAFTHARYPLVGEHATAACSSCHGTSRTFRGTPRRCGDAACHARDDAHRGALGTACDRCHLATGENRFNHVISAKYKLDGKHLTVPCADCHPSRAFKPRPFACAGCHPEPAVHKGVHGTFCERCHTTQNWAAR